MGMQFQRGEGGTETNIEFSMKQAECVTSDGVQHDVRSGDGGQAEFESKKEKKVWTSNDLYGWRKKKYIPKKYLGPQADFKPSCTEQGPPSTMRENESQGVPAKGTNIFKTLLQEIKSNNNSSSIQTGSGVKRKQNFNFGEGSSKRGKDSKCLDLGMELEISEPKGELKTKKT